MKKLGKLFAAILAATLAAVCLFTACDGGQEQGGDETPAMVSAIEITGAPSDSKLDVGETVTLGYKATPADAEPFTVTWSTSDAAVATVGSDGTVTGVAEGPVVITVSVDGTEISAQKPLLVEEPVVPVPVEEISFEGVSAEETIARGGSKTFTVKSQPEECDPFELEWTSKPAGVVTVQEYADNVAVIAEDYGTATVTATVAGTDISASFTVKVEGDIDINNGTSVETFSRGQVNPNGTFYTTADRTQELEDGAPVYEGAFLNAAAVNRPSAADVSLQDGRLMWTLYNSQNYERVTFYYTGEIKAEKTYLIRVPMESTAFSGESGLGINVNYGIRVLKGKNTENDPQYGLTYNNTATSGLNDESADSLTAYNPGAPVNDKLARDRANIMFTKVGETYYAEIYADGSTWNGEFYIGCDGGRNREEGDTAGSVTIAFDNIMITDTAAVTYADTVETFDRGDFTGDTAIVNTFKENPMMESELLTITANRANFFAIRDEITEGTASSYGDAAPMGSTGNIFRWCTSRILDKDTDFSVPSADGGAQGLVHQTLTIKFKEGTFDPAKGYTVTIPVMFAQHDISVEGQEHVPGAEGISIEAFDAESEGALLNEGNTYLFDTKNRKGLLELTIAAGSDWDGTIRLCFYWDGVMGRKVDGVEVLSQATFYFDNISLNEIAE